MKEKNKSIILVFGLLFAISCISIYFFGNVLAGNNSSIEISDEKKSSPPKASGSWFLENITIDPTGATSGSLTWAEAVALPAGWCSGAGTWSDPYVIENVTIDASTSPTGSGIYINNSENVCFIINKVTVYNAASGGINLENTNNGTLIYNNCSNNDKGISLYNCVNITISRNDVLDNVVCGIYLVNCNNNTLLRNTAKYNHKDGIGLIYSNNNTLFGNIARNNDDLGIFLWYCNYTHLSQNLASNNLFFGFWIYNSTKNTFFNNTVDYNGYDGIYFSGSENNSIIRNTIQNNRKFGIELDANSNFNRIFNNTLIDNDVGCIEDYGTGNIHKNNICINPPRIFDLRLLFLIFIILLYFFIVLFLFMSYKKNKERGLNEKESSESKEILMKDNSSTPHHFQYKCSIILFGIGIGILIPFYNTFWSLLGVMFMGGGFGIFLIYYEQKWINRTYLQMGLIATILFSIVYGILEYLFFDTDWNNWFQISDWFPNKYFYWTFMTISNLIIVFIASRKSIALSLLSALAFMVNEDLWVMISKSLHEFNYAFPVYNWYDDFFPLQGLGEPIPIFPYWPRFYFVFLILISILIFVQFKNLEGKKFLITLAIFIGACFLCLLLVPN